MAACCDAASVRDKKEPKMQKGSDPGAFFYFCRLLADFGQKKALGRLQGL